MFVAIEGYGHVELQQGVENRVSEVVMASRASLTTLAALQCQQYPLQHTHT